MLKETKNTEQNTYEIKASRRQVFELRVIEQRCQQAEAALKSFEERNRLLADSAPLGIFTTDTQGGVTGISRKMLEMLPWPDVDDQNSMNLSDCQAMIESGILADIQRCIEHREQVIAEHPTTTSQGAWALLRYHLSPIPGTNGTVSGVMAIVEDYTDLKRTIVALRQSERRFRDQALRVQIYKIFTIFSSTNIISLHLSLILSTKPARKYSKKIKMSKPKHKNDRVVKFNPNYTKRRSL